MEETIAAIATAPGEAGIGIIRISGEHAIQILDEIFSASKESKISDYDSRKLIYGHIIDHEKNEKIDEVLAVYMKAPNTYTREDVVEIQCHGGLISSKKIIELVLRKGARVAEKGEFTKRAFLNGRIDLAQAEAVIDLISAKTDKGFDIALDQLEGHLSKAVHKIKEHLLEIIAKITVNIDFPEEDIEEVTYKEIEMIGLEIKDEIAKLLATADAGKVMREGLNTVIVGKPNVGKSSLLNELLKESRAIVTDVPGTTRDIIEEVVNIQGIPLKIVDTAGIRATEDAVEKIGVERSKLFFNSADLIIFVLNGAEDLSEEDKEIIELLESKKAIVLINKSDLPRVVDLNYLKNRLGDKEIIEISLVTQEGVQKLEDAIVKMVYNGEVQQGEACFINNARHKNALEKALGSISEAIEMTRRNEALDFVEVDIKNTWSYLGEITGDTVSENIIDAIFSRFCLGK